MKIKMFMRPEQMKKYRDNEAAFASTFRDSNTCFEIEVEQNQIDLENNLRGLPTNNYFIVTNESA